MFSRIFRKPAPTPIDPIAEAKLDVALNEPGQQWVAQSVKRLDNEDASLAWRSALNEKLFAERSRLVARRKRIAILRPVAGLAVASALAFVLIVPRDTIKSGSTSMNLEENVIQAHVVAENNYRLTGAAIVSRDTDTRAVPQTASYDWEEADLGAL